MREDTLGNRFMERYENECRHRVRSKDGRILERSDRCWRRKKNERGEEEERVGRWGMSRRPSMRLMS
jgi:hypothetical protein